MTTLLLDIDTWDLCIDTNGDIACAAAPYAVAQDAASAVRTFRGECYYDQNQGVPWLSDVLGHRPPLSLVKADIVAEALRVPGCATATAYLSAVSARKLTGQIQVTDSDGVTTNVGF